MIEMVGRGIAGKAREQEPAATRDAQLLHTQRTAFEDSLPAKSERIEERIRGVGGAGVGAGIHLRMRDPHAAPIGRGIGRERDEHSDVRYVYGWIGGARR